MQRSDARKRMFIWKDDDVGDEATTLGRALTSCVPTASGLIPLDSLVGQGNATDPILDENLRKKSS